MKRSLKTLVACAAFTVCMSAGMIVSYAATDLKLDPVALVAYAQDAASTEGGVSVPGSELFIGLETGTYTFADVAASLEDYGLQYEITDGAQGSVYLIGSAIELGPNGTFEDPLSAEASYNYAVVGDDYQPVIVTIATKNAEEVATVIVAGVSDVAENGLPDEVTDTLNDIYTGIADVAPDIIGEIENQAPVVLPQIVEDVTEGYSDVIDQAINAIQDASPDDVQDFIDSAVGDIAGTIGDVVEDVAGAVGDAIQDVSIDDLLAFLFQ